MAFTHPHINAFVIVGGDSDFISLVEKLKQYDKKIFIVGGRQFTSADPAAQLPRVHRLREPDGRRRGAGGRDAGDGRGDVRVDRAPIEQAVPLVTRALKVLSEREVSPQLGLLKTTLLQLDSTFSERTYGAGSFRDFAAEAREGRRAACVTRATADGWSRPADGAGGCRPERRCRQPRGAGRRSSAAAPTRARHRPPDPGGAPTAVIGTRRRRRARARAVLGLRFRSAAGRCICAT